MNLQLQSRFFSLSGEIRDMIYGLVLLDGATQQHVVRFESGSHARIPCYPVPDEVYLKDLSETAFQSCIQSTTIWRGGHLGCLARLQQALDSRYSRTRTQNELQAQGSQLGLSSPVPALLTCRRVYEEALPIFYSLAFHGTLSLGGFLSQAPRSTLDRVRSLEATIEFIDPNMKPAHNLRLMQKLTKDSMARIANLKALYNFKLVLYPQGNSQGAAALPDGMIEMLNWVKPPNFEVVWIDDAEVTQGLPQNVPVPSSFVLTKRREPAWVRERARLVEHGQMELKNL